MPERLVNGDEKGCERKSMRKPERPEAVVREQEFNFKEPSYCLFHPTFSAMYKLVSVLSLRKHTQHQTFIQHQSMDLTVQTPRIVF